MNELFKWAHDWGISQTAIHDLVGRMSPPVPGYPDSNRSEAAVQVDVRLEASRKGIRLWRNNVGAIKTDTGMIRFGLANDSKGMNDNIKSSDLIGIRPGGQFVAREIKHAGWKYSGTDREQAQLKFIILVNSLGGDAGFATGEGTL